MQEAGSSFVDISVVRAGSQFLDWLIVLLAFSTTIDLIRIVSYRPGVAFFCHENQDELRFSFFFWQKYDEEQTFAAMTDSRFRFSSWVRSILFDMEINML